MPEKLRVLAVRNCFGESRSPITFGGEDFIGTSRAARCPVCVDLLDIIDALAEILDRFGEQISTLPLRLSKSDACRFRFSIP